MSERFTPAEAAKALLRRANHLENERDNGYCRAEALGCSGHWHPNGETEHVPGCTLAAAVYEFREAARLLQQAAEDAAALAQVTAERDRLKRLLAETGAATWGGENAELARRVQEATKETP